MSGTSQTTTNEILNRTLLGIPPPSPCPLCAESCQCGWSNDKPPESVDYGAIWPNEQESQAKNDFIQQGRKTGLQCTANLFKVLEKISDEKINDHGPGTQREVDSNQIKENEQNCIMEIMIDRSENGDVQYKQIKDLLQPRLEARGNYSCLWKKTRTLMFLVSHLD